MLKLVKWTTLSFLALSIHALPTVHLPAKIMQYTPKSHRVTVTAYTNSSSCGKGDSNVTAAAVRIKPSHYQKLIALSRDIAMSYNFGDRFQLWVNKKLYRVTFLDSMSKKHTNKVDLLLPSLQDCRKFGKKTGVLIPLNET
jgi:3D (Asp-Asp-Asp) domain-containing protein